MRLLSLLALLLAISSIDGRAQQRASRAPALGGVEGDVFLLFMSGDVVPVAGRTVHLLRWGAALDSSRLRFCRHRDVVESEIRADYDRTVRPLSDSVRAAEPRGATAASRYQDNLRVGVLLERLGPLRDSVARAAEARRSRLRTVWLDSLLTHRVASAPTGLQAHYRFDGVQAGRYVLYTEADIPRERLTLQRQWWAFVQIVPDTVKRLDLDNAFVLGQLYYCPDTGRAAITR